MHFLVLGATGAIGSIFCHKALAQGHSLTLFVRNPGKLSTVLKSNSGVLVIKGEVGDRAVLEQASQCHADVFVSFAGPLGDVKGTPLADGLKILLPMLPSQGTKRALILCTPSYPSISDSPTLIWRFARVYMRLFRFAEYSEMLGVGNIVTAQSMGQLQWTLFRVGRLLDEPEATVEATFLGSDNAGMSVSREGVASWVLKEAVENKWMGKAPYICNERHN